MADDGGESAAIVQQPTVAVTNRTADDVVIAGEPDLTLLPPFERKLVQTHRWFGHGKIPSYSEICESCADEGPEVVSDRLIRRGEATDRKNAGLLTGAAFMTALSGAPIAAAASNPVAYAPSAVTALFAFLIALRSLTRRVEERHAGLPADWQCVAIEREVLTAKWALSWASARVLRVSALLLVIALVVNAFL